jgi:nucleoid-associated protein YgaU
MHRWRFSVPGIVVLAVLVLAGCAPRTSQSQRINEAQVAIELARAAGAPERSPEEFNAALRALRESEAYLTAGDSDSVALADQLAVLAEGHARLAMTATRLSLELEKVKREAQAARQEAERARAELERMQSQIRAAEEASRTVQAPPERSEAQPAEPGRQAAPPAAPATPRPTLVRYIVNKGDTLRNLAARPEIYGDANQWTRIYEANREIIGPDRKLRIGQVLIIPKP